MARAGEMAIFFSKNGCVRSAEPVNLPEWSCLPLRSGAVHVYTLHLREDSPALGKVQAVLSADELERASRIRVERMRQEFILGRAMLRTVAGAATRCEPREVEFQVEQYGKPFTRGIHSNVTHSRGLIYVAISKDSPLGIDVEWIDPELEVMEIAEANFEREEIAVLAALSAGHERAHAFCQFWTRKEAMAKADGRGLQIPLHDIRAPHSNSGVGWIPAANAEANEASEDENYFVQDLIAPFGYSAALAIKGSALPVTISTFLLD